MCTDYSECLGEQGLCNYGFYRLGCSRCLDALRLRSQWGATMIELVERRYCSARERPEQTSTPSGIGVVVNSSHVAHLAVLTMLVLKCRSLNIVPYYKKQRMKARGRRGKPGAGSGHESTAAPHVSELGTQARKLKRLARRLLRRGRVLGIKARRRLAGEETGGVRAENVVWIFGAGRTGSTWLSRMMGELKGHAVWFEPWVGALVDPYHLRLEDREGEHFILAPEYRKTWLKSIRRFVMEGAFARFPGVAGQDEYLVIKEPGGSAGAPLLAEALPESRMVLLVRDPRDVVASWMDARREGGWRRNDADRSKGEERPETLADKDPDAYVRERAKSYLRNMGEAK